MDDFAKDFEETQKAGCERHGIDFVAAQETAMNYAFGGIFEPFDWSDKVKHAQFSRIVLAVMNAAVKQKRKRKSK